MAFLLFRLPLLVVCQGATVVYPLYASYKAITAASRQHSSVSSYSWASSPRRPSQDVGPDGVPVGGTTELAELETWVMYWSIIGCMRVTETFAEWSWSWFPLYFEAKLLFCLWLVLPQTRGATYLYVTYLGPLLATHEDDIDVAMSAARVRAKKMGADWAERAWKAVKSAVLSSLIVSPRAARNGMEMPADVFLGDSLQSDEADKENRQTGASAPTSSAPPPNNAQPVAANNSPLTGFLKSYAPQAIAGAAALLESARAGARTEAIVTSRARAADAGAAPHPPSQSSVPSVRGTMSRTESAVRRKQLERALAELDAASASFNRSGGIDSDSDTATTGGYLQTPKRAEGEKRKMGNGLGMGLDGSFDMLDQVDFESSSTAAAHPSPGADTSADRSWGSWLKRTASGGIALSPRKKEE